MLSPSVEEAVLRSRTVQSMALGYKGASVAILLAKSPLSPL